MKIIFLDVDGVLNTNTTIERYNGFAGWEMKFVDRLNRIIRETGAALVISSSWRMDLSRAQLLALFNHKMGISETIIGSTPAFSESVRGLEIAEWMNTFEKSRGRNVERFVIIDDDDPGLFREMDQDGLFEWADGGSCG